MATRRSTPEFLLPFEFEKEIVEASNTATSIAEQRWSGLQNEAMAIIEKDGIGECKEV
jgi:hypothetical protein